MNKQKLKTFIVYSLVILSFGILGYEMPKIIAWFKPGYSIAENTKYFPNPNTKVVIYTTSWCPFCQKTRDYLKSKNVPFAELDIEQNEVGKAQYSEFGTEAIPVVLIGNRRILGFKPDVFEDSLNQLGK